MRVVCIGMMILSNVIMWVLFTRSLQNHASTAKATVVNNACNFLFSVSIIIIIRRCGLCSIVILEFIRLVVVWRSPLINVVGGVLFDYNWFYINEQ